MPNIKLPKFEPPTMALNALIIIAGIGIIYNSVLLWRAVTKVTPLPPTGVVVDNPVPVPPLIVSTIDSCEMSSKHYFKCQITTTLGDKLMVRGSYGDKLVINSTLKGMEVRDGSTQR